MKTLSLIALLMLATLAGCAPRSRPGPTTTKSTAATTAPDKLPGVSSPVRVSAEGLNAAEPAVASGRDGAVYVAWVGHGAGKEADVWLTRVEVASEGDGGSAKQTRVEPARVNPNPGEATAWRGDAPDVAVAQDGTAYVAWTARADGGAGATTLYVSASRDGGRSFGAPVKVNDDSAPGVHGMHSLAVGEDGRVYVAWLDERDLADAQTDAHAPVQMSGKMPMQHGEHNREVFFSYSADGGRTFSENRRIAVEACPCCKTSLAVSRGGRVYVGWRQVLPGDFRHVAVASSADGGETFGAPTIVSDDRWELRGCPVSGPALAAGEGDRLRVVWYTAGDAGTPGLYSSESADGGRTFTPRRALSEGGVRGTPQLLSDAQEVVAVFEGEGGGGSAALLEARLDREGGVAPNGRAQLGAGELPAAAVLGGRVYTAYISQGGVWLVSAGL
jgi:hypothetical protein